MCHIGTSVSWTSEQLTIRRIEKMKIVLIHGQSHEGSTCMTARKLTEKIITKQEKREEGKLQEFFLPKDFDEPCLG